MTFGLQIGVFGFNKVITEGFLKCLFKILQPGLSPIKSYMIRFLNQLVPDVAAASYQRAIVHAAQKIQGIKKLQGSKSGMYVKCFIQV